MMYICLFTFKAQCDIVEIESIKTISVSSTQLIKSLVRNASHDEAKNYIHKRYITKLLKRESWGANVVASTETLCSALQDIVQREEIVSARQQIQNHMEQYSNCSKLKYRTVKYGWFFSVTTFVPNLNFSLHHLRQPTFRKPFPVMYFVLI